MSVKRAFSKLSSNEYKKIRLFCESQDIDLDVLEDLVESEFQRETLVLMDDNTYWTGTNRQRKLQIK